MNRRTTAGIGVASPLGVKPRMELTREAVKRQLDAWAKEGYSASSLNHLRQSLLTLWKAFDPEGKHPQCPAKTIPKCKENNVRQGFFEETQFPESD